MRETFRSLRVRNFRLFCMGQLVSLAGLWMQQVAEVWLVLELTDSGVAVGVVAGLHFAPLLLFGPWAGVLADRMDKQRLLFVAEALLAVLAATLGILAATGAIRLWMVFGLAFLSGLGTAFENPTRRSLVPELVDRDDISNAVSLTSTLVATSRSFGPALGGLLVGWVGVAPVFLLNAASYLAAIASLVAMDTAAMRRPERLARGRGQVRDGLRYVLRNPRVRMPMVLMAVVGTLAFNHPVVVPLMAAQVFGAGPALFGLLMSLVSIGAIGGSIFSASRRSITHALLARVTLVLGVVLFAAAVAPNLPLFMVVLVAVGAAGSSFIAGGTGIVQRDTEPQMVGRVMALYSVAFLGSTAIGGPMTGFISEALSPRVAFALGGTAALLAGVLSVSRARMLVQTGVDERQEVPQGA